MRLFIDRAAQVQTTFAVTNQNAPALASISQRLDGIPLAIELAAARVRSLTVEDINARLSQRFRLLTGGSRTAVPRQQTLRSLIDWSYDLLQEAEKAALNRLSVFVGGWSLEDAEDVCTGEGLSGGSSIEEWEVMDLLTSLCDKSLVIVEPVGDTTRYRLLETVRQYALERLSESGGAESSRSRHLHVCLRMTERFDSQLSPAHRAAALERDHDNMRAALAWAIGGDSAQVQLGLQLAIRLQFFWAVRGHLKEARHWFTALLDRCVGEETEVRCAALAQAAELARMEGDDEAARSYLTESLALSQKSGNAFILAFGLNNLGWLEFRAGDIASARRLHAEAAAVSRAAGVPSQEALSLTRLGAVATEAGDFDEAAELLARALGQWRQIGHPSGIALALACRGEMERRRGQPVEAMAILREAVRLCRDVGDLRVLLIAFRELAALSVGQDQGERAACLYGAMTSLQTRIGYRPTEAERAALENDLLTLRAALGTTGCGAAQDRGRTLPLEDAIALALD